VQGDAIYSVEAFMAIYHAKDNCFKRVLGNNQLLVQFLRDFIPTPLENSAEPD
jgi:hypothetical protein